MFFFARRHKAFTRTNVDLPPDSNFTIYYSHQFLNLAWKLLMQDVGANELNKNMPYIVLLNK